MPTFEDWQWNREYDKVTQNEARFLELASRPGMESLRRWCSVWNVGYGHATNCECKGRTWLPLYVAERMGALVRVAQKIRGDALFSYWESDPEPEVALTEALLSATEKTGE